MKVKRIVMLLFAALTFWGSAQAATAITMGIDLDLPEAVSTHPSTWYQDGKFRNFRFLQPEEIAPYLSYQNPFGFAPDFIPEVDESTVLRRFEKFRKWDFKMDYNRHVSNMVDLYTNRIRHRLPGMLGRKAIYFPIIEEKLAEAGLPNELKYLTVIESALHPVIKSSAGAQGLWQFMPGTARDYGLRVDKEVDERRDPYKSTDAAIAYLKDLYRQYKDWHLVLAAYNCGPGNVNKAIRKSRGARNYWTIWKYLPRETRSYVPAFIGAAYAFEYADEYNLSPEYQGLWFDETGVPVNVEGTTLQDAAATLGMDYESLKALNPELMTDKIPASADKPYQLRTPRKVAERYAFHYQFVRNWLGIDLV